MQSGKQSHVKLNLKDAKVTTDREKEPHRRTTVAPDYTPFDEVNQNRLNKIRVSDIQQRFQHIKEKEEDECMFQDVPSWEDVPSFHRECECGWYFESGWVQCTDNPVHTTSD